ncbi:lysophospholipid acyltransferase family protein [Cognatishimia activa]|uniref:2-acyl-glycerophospho-ethanolamine acyltransferase n=1 Tax=Cognatishimia activa TaxID=1715691 RepID=A0A0P1IP36_9RHOB|nr:lysophospholipid acyltransferase family protein [Cognatishimia activa]CUJ28121.1 2-acyl-glycerophospho-ethanolamine acyltransferase [Cognatishimia activa]CUK25265.1 2-acyl-glycerophospho-ethanolamine acyltransferase [Cognatishimia activa]
MSSPTWTGDEDYPAPIKISAIGWCRVLLRGLPVVAILLVGIFTLTLIRLIERPIFGLRRPIGGHVPSIVCRIILFVLGIRFRVSGKPMAGGGAVVANHSSWLDIVTLNAGNPVFFVSKSEVAKWPGIGFLAKITGTVFINRDRKEARQQTKVFEDRLAAGQKLLFFPEGTSTDAIRVLPFKSTLFQAFLSDELKPKMRIQPVTVNYIAPEGEDARFYGWWGDMDFGAHMLQTLSAQRHGNVEVVYHTPIQAADYANRKTLAAYTEATVRNGHFRTKHSQ